jgi:hypothetical protein
MATVYQVQEHGRAVFGLLPHEVSTTFASYRIPTNNCDSDAAVATSSAIYAASSGRAAFARRPMRTTLLAR